MVISGDQRDMAFLMREAIRQAISGDQRRSGRQGVPEEGRHQVKSEAFKRSIKNPSKGHQKAIKRPSRGHQEAIKRPSRGNQEAN